MLFHSDGAPLSASIIDDVDIYNGLVYLRPGVLLPIGTKVDFTYIENNYEYPYLNINGHFSQNPNLLNKFVVFYIIPRESIASARTNRTVYHIIGDSLNEAIDSIEQLNGDLPIAIIGSYNIQQVITSDRTTILDTRVKGGGLVDQDEGLKSVEHNLDNVLDPEAEVFDHLEDIYKDSARFWDIGHYDGEPYPGAAAVVIDVPEHIRPTLPEGDIKDKATKFLAAGVYPVFEYSDRSGLYMTGFSTAIDNLGNIDFSSTTGYWTKQNQSIPGDTVLATTDWSTFDPNVLSTTGADGGQVMSVPQGSGYFQSYLKSTPDACIEWEERYLVHPTGKQYSNPMYSTWEKKRFVDDRPVPNGQLTKGFISLNALYEDKQYRKFSIFSPYRSSSTGDFLQDLGGGIFDIARHLSDQSFSGGRITKTTNISGNSQGPESNYVGMHSGYKGLFRAATHIHAKHALSNLASGAFRNLTGALNSTVGFSVYDVPAKAFNSNYTGTFSMSTQLEMLTEAMRWSMREYGSGSTEYQTTLTGYYDIIQAMSGKSYYPVPHPQYITPDYRVSGGVFTGLSIPATTGLVAIQTPDSDHRITEILPAMMGLWSALSGFAFPTSLSRLDDVPSVVRNTYSGIISGYGKLILTGAWLDGEGSSIADHWYVSHNRHGLVAGSIARDGLRIVQHIQSGHDWVGSASSQAGSTAQSITDYRNDIRTILDTVKTGVHTNTSRAGIHEADLPILLEAYALYDKIYAEERYRGYYQTGIKAVLKGIVSTEGDIQRRAVIDQDLGPFVGTPPTDILRALAIGANHYTSYLSLLQGAFRTTTGNYSYSGSYPIDANLVDKKGGFEYETLDAFADVLWYVGNKFTGDQNYLKLARVHGITY